MNFYWTVIFTLFFVVQSYCHVDSVNQVVIVLIDDSIKSDTLSHGRISIQALGRSESIDEISKVALFESVEPKEIVFSIEAEGYIPLEISETVTSVDSNNFFTFQLTKVRPDNFYIYGKILRQDKHGIEGAKVIINESTSATSNKIGYYLLGIDLKNQQFKADSTAFSVKAEGFKTLNDRVILKPQVLERNFELLPAIKPPPHDKSLKKPNFLKPKYSIPFAGGLAIAVVYGCQALDIHKTWNENLKDNNEYDINNEYYNKNEEYKCRQKGFWTGVGVMFVSGSWFIIDKIIYNNRRGKIDLTTSSNSIGLSLKF